MSDDMLRVCYTHEVGMQNLDPDRLPFGCANCGEDSEIVKRIQIRVAALEAEVERLRARAERAEAAIREWARLAREKDALANRDLDDSISAGEGARHFRAYNTACRALLEIDAALAAGEGE